MLTDPIADMIARIRNALMRKKKEVCMPASRLKLAILDVLFREGYIRGYAKEDEKSLKVDLKYFDGKPVIQYMKRVSKPSMKVYSSVRKMKPVANGLGNAVLTTSLGVLSDREAKSRCVGGKILMIIK